MPANIVPTLDPRSAYIYCPACLQNGNKVILSRDTYQFRCQFAHTYEYSQLQAMAAAGELVEMVKTRIVEQPSDQDVKREVWVHPILWERLQEKFQGRFLVTMRTIFAALADDSIIFIEGPDIKELKLYGVKNAKDIVSAIKSARELEDQIKILQKQLDLLQPILQAAGLEAK
jgi:hypothetical protein